MSCCNASRASDPNTEKPDYLNIAKGDDLYEKALKSYYFPFLLKFHRHVCFLWLAVFVISIVFGPSFLGLTKSDLELPPGTSSEIASNAFKQNYPERSQ